MPCQTRLIHLAHLDKCHDSTNYAIRARVVFDFRDGKQLTSVRLAELSTNVSSQKSGSLLELYLRGRWRTALAVLYKECILHIECATILTCPNPTGRPICLQLEDPMPAARLTVPPAVYMLKPSGDPELGTTYATLDNGLSPPSPDTLHRFATGFSSWKPIGITQKHDVAVPSLHKNQVPRVIIGERAYGLSYTALSNLHEVNNHSQNQRVNLFGVIVDSRAPCVTRGTDLRSEVVIVDESSFEPGCPEKKIIAYTFERKPENGIPFRAFGDIIRIHRAHIDHYMDSKGTGNLFRQVRLRFYSTCVLWRYDDDSFIPVASRNPVETNARNERSDPAHTITSYDRRRVADLRVFVRCNLLTSRINTSMPYLRSVTELFGFADCRGIDSNTSVDFLCLIEREINCPGEFGALRLFVSDGHCRAGLGRPYVSVVSRISDYQRQHAPNTSFIKFIPCWDQRPKFPTWALIKDANLVITPDGPQVILSVGRKTSTILFQDTQAPLVRYFGELIRNVDFNQGVPSHATQHTAQGYWPPIQIGTIYNNGHSIPIANGNGYNSVSECVHSNLIREGRYQEPTIGIARNGTSFNGSDIAAQTGVNEGDGSMRNQTSALKRARASANPNQSGAPNLNELNDNSGDDECNGDRRGAPRRRSVETDFRRMTKDRMEERIVTKPETQHCSAHTVSLVQVMVDVRRGIRMIHRVLIRARACMWPKDVELACRPVCIKCHGSVYNITSSDDNATANSGQKPLACRGCSTQFEGRCDPRITWAIAIRLWAEDKAGDRIDLWIEGKDATTFFNDFIPTSLADDEFARKNLCSMLEQVLSGGNWMDCCIRGYEYTDGVGVYRVACKLVATRLIK